MTRATVLGLGIVLAFATPVTAQTALLRQPSPRPVLYADVMPSASIAVTDSTASGESALGTYDRLSVGNRKIARALYEAQQPDGQRLSLDEIAAMKRSGSGWGEVFKTMRARGLVTDRNLGQVVSRSNKVSASLGETTTATNRPDAFDDSRHVSTKQHGAKQDGKGGAVRAVDTGRTATASRGSSSAHGGGHGRSK
jgi:hypothetical protein